MIRWNTIENSIYPDDRIEEYRGTYVEQKLYKRLVEVDGFLGVRKMFICFHLNH